MLDYRINLYIIWISNLLNYLVSLSLSKCNLQISGFKTKETKRLNLTPSLTQWSTRLYTNYEVASSIPGISMLENVFKVNWGFTHSREEN